MVTFYIININVSHNQSVLVAWLYTLAVKCSKFMYTIAMITSIQMKSYFEGFCLGISNIYPRYRVLIHPKGLTVKNG